MGGGGIGYLSIRYFQYVIIFPIIEALQIVRDKLSLISPPPPLYEYSFVNLIFWLTIY